MYLSIQANANSVIFKEKNVDAIRKYYAKWVKLNVFVFHELIKNKKIIIDAMY
jgi:hypothetical protein